MRKAEADDIEENDLLDMDKNTSMNDLLKILAAPFIGLVIQWITNARSKARLKTDLELLEIYKKTDSESDNYKAFKAEIDKRLKNAYSIENPRRTDIDVSDLSWGVAFLAIAITIASGCITEKNVWQVSIAAGFGIGAVVAFRKAFERKFRKSPSPGPGDVVGFSGVSVTTQANRSATAN